MKISKAIAEHVAKVMTRPQAKVISALYEELQISVTTNYLASLPSEVKETFHTHPDYFRVTTSVYHFKIGGHVHFHNIDKPNTVYHLPEKLHKTYIPTDAEEKLARKKEKLELEHKRLILEIQQAVIALGTYKRVSEQFPEAIPHLPKLGRTEIMIDLTSLRSRVSQSVVSE
ncbi:MAG: hypothetical protein Q8K92_26640 [Leadbetterella sp.]|nr:hypothetical protein [Leadbetterella sp.]